MALNSKQEDKYQKYKNLSSKSFYNFLDLHIHYQFILSKLKIGVIMLILGILSIIPFIILGTTPAEIVIKSKDDAIVKYLIGPSKKINKGSYDGFNVEFLIVKESRFLFMKRKVIDSYLDGCSVVFYKGKQNAGDLKTLSYRFNNEDCYMFSKLSPLLKDKIDDVEKKIQKNLENH